MFKRLFFLLLAITLVLGGCDSSTNPAAGPNSPTTSATPTANSDSVGEAYHLLLQNSAEPVKPAALGAAAVKGLRAELSAEGVIPPDVSEPAFTADANQDLVLIHDAAQVASDRYDAKLLPDQAEAAMIDGMAQSVGDCHTVYLTPSELKQQLDFMNDATRFGGIGAELHKTQIGDPLVIWRVFDGSPAQKAGLRSGDVIRGVDGKDVTGYTAQDAVNLIRGTVGTPVTLEILSPGHSSPHTVVVQRGQIQPPDVEYRMLQNHIGYVEIYGYSQNTASDVRNALNALDGQGATAWVIDLRDNGGGLLSSVSQSLSMFLPKDTPLYYLTDASGKRTEYKADGSVRSHIPPIVILTNSETASGAELFTAGLSENGLARVVGQTTAGCVGTGQLFPLPDGSGIQVTVAKMLTGKGKSLNRVGVTPDYPVSMTVQDLIAGRDPQLAKAIQVLSGP